MTIVDVLFISIGGFFGAVLRYFLSRTFNHEHNFPVGTFIANLAGSFLIGVIFGMTLPKVWILFLVSGLLGALTTFSTLQKEVIQLWQEGKKQLAISYCFFTYGGGIFFALVGYLSAG